MSHLSAIQPTNLSTPEIGCKSTKKTATQHGRKIEVIKSKEESSGKILDVAIRLFEWIANAFDNIFTEDSSMDRRKADFFARCARENKEIFNAAFGGGRKTSADAMSELVSSGTNKMNELVSSGTNKMNELVSSGNDRMGKLVSSGNDRMNALVSSGTNKMNALVSSGANRMHELASSRAGMMHNSSDANSNLAPATQKQIETIKLNHPGLLEYMEKNSNRTGGLTQVEAAEIIKLGYTPRDKSTIRWMFAPTNPKAKENRMKFEKAGDTKHHFRHINKNKRDGVNSFIFVPNGDYGNARSVKSDTDPSKGPQAINTYCKAHDSIKKAQKQGDSPGWEKMVINHKDGSVRTYSKTHNSNKTSGSFKTGRVITINS